MVQPAKNSFSGQPLGKEASFDVRLSPVPQGKTEEIQLSG